MRVDLTPPELAACHTAGVMRHLSAKGGAVTDRQKGLQDKTQIDVDGVIAEYCFAKLANLCPDFTASPRKGGADLVTRQGKTVDVKSTRHANGRLLGDLKKPVDGACDLYVLMIVDDRGATFAGWATYAELFDDANLVDLGHGIVYALEQSRLRKWERVAA